MKLNPDCIRDLLITLEERTGTHPILFDYNDSNSIGLGNYDPNVLTYHFNQCVYANLIIINTKLDGGCLITDITPQAHEFLANIRLDTNWNKTKDTAKKVGSTALSALIQISSNVITHKLMNI